MLPRIRYFRFSISVSVLETLNARSRLKKQQEMQAAVKEGVKSQRPAELNQPVQAGDFSQRRHRHRQHQKNQRHHAGGEDEKILRIRAELVVGRVPDQQRQRHQRR